VIVGIDLGTTNSLISIWRDGAPVVIPNALGETLTPSVVSVDETTSILVGRAALERLWTHPDKTAAAFKRYMGSGREIRLGGRSFRPEELSALVLKSLKADAEAFLGGEVKDAVITVPAYFSDAQRKATRIAGELAGLNVIRLVNEPTAAALAYGMHQRGAETRFLVFDLGGGTFDVSVLELFEGVMEVRASAGDNFLGGEDFVSALADAFMDDTGTRALETDAKSVRRLRDLMEQTKRRLTAESDFEVKFEHAGKSHAWQITEARFETLAAALLERVKHPIESALRDSRIRAAELDDVILVGGATRMPMVRRLAARLFGRLPSQNLNPDEVVAMGAAVQAGLVARDSALKEIVMTDVCPYSMGVDVSRKVEGRYEHGYFMPLIERNVTVPVSKSGSFGTTADDQTLVHFKIYQGEGRKVEDNILLGELRVPVPARKAGEVQVEMRFTYDLSGVLEAEAHVPETKLVKRVVIEGNPGVLTPEEIRQRFAALATLKIHPRDQMVNRTLLARASRVYEQSLGEQREVVQHYAARFEAALERQDPAAIEAAARELTELVARIEQDWTM
jgi:molecular chaperone HscC